MADHKADKDNFMITIRTLSDIASDPDLLHNLVSIINKAFRAPGSAFQSSRLRFEYDEEMIEQIGSDALCAIMTLDGRIIASACLKQWRPPRGGIIEAALKQESPDDYQLLCEEGLSWEVKAVVTADEPLTRNKGLAGRCVDVLLDQVMTQYTLSTSKGLLLWVQVIEIQAGAYWRRRGYEQVGPSELKPRGMFGSFADFWYTTLCKRIQPGILECTANVPGANVF
jgi:hypothetical protein